MIDKQSILFICSHHRNSKFFDTTINRIIKSGYTNFILQDTSAPSNPLAGINIDIKNKVEHFYIHDTGYFNSLIYFKRYIKEKKKEYDYIFLIDNDTFLSDTKYLDTFIETAVDSKLDFISSLANGEIHSRGRKYNYPQFNNEIIVQVLNQTIDIQNCHPQLLPNPNWENQYTLIKRSVWDNLEEQDLLHTYDIINKLVEINASLGAHITKYKEKYSHYGTEWFHVGYLMNTYYDIENGNFEWCIEHQDISIPRIGYFLAQSNIYGENIYPDNIKQNLKLAYDKFGIDNINKSWNNLIRNTCMESWCI